jgi:putative two-component system response regulator
MALKNNKISPAMLLEIRLKSWYSKKAQLYSLWVLPMALDAKMNVLVVDSNQSLVQSIVQPLKKTGYTTLRCKDSMEVQDALKKVHVDIALVGISMPPVAGVELYRKIAESSIHIPIIMLVPVEQVMAAVAIVKKGAFDFLVTTPFDEEYLFKIVKKAADYVRASQIEIRYKGIIEAEVKKKVDAYNEMLTRARLSTREMVQRLLTAAEYRDDETGNHVKRIGMYTVVLAANLNLDNSYKETIAVASSIHDIGKIGIPDAVLLKPAGLTAEESETMKRHTKIGHDILAGSTNAYLKMAATIALGHHERWDGTGYPNRLKGEAVPLECRIVNICDQYDALRSIRPYKKAFDHQTSFTILSKGDGRTKPEHFDPQVLNAFIKTEKMFEKVYDMNVQKAKTA